MPHSVSTATAGLGDPPPAPSTRLPRILNLGSGRAFDERCFNVDVEEGWGPDAVLDIERPLFGSGDTVELTTQRFGRVRLAPGSFDLIVAHDVLEHLRDLRTAMTNCLELLAVGGSMSILVPYELGLGAWSDPTHVRAFNERSWVYYCEWFWYLGWTEARFQTTRLDIVPSTYGEELRARDGTPTQELIRIPRAVDGLDVQLVKVELTEEDRAELARHRRGGGVQTLQMQHPGLREF
jgi:SAM-dependent methyltransferase